MNSLDLPLLRLAFTLHGTVVKKVMMAFWGARSGLGSMMSMEIVLNLNISVDIGCLARQYPQASIYRGRYI